MQPAHLGHAPPVDPDHHVVLHCPVTAVPFTHKMASMVGLGEHDLQNMVTGIAPLGIGRDHWASLSHAMYSAFHESGLDDEHLQLKIGGSSVGGFSSLQTTLKKKFFPPDEQNLIDRVRQYRGRNVPHGSGLDAIQHEVGGIERAVNLFRSFKASERPRSPWWGSLHALGIEPAPDVDVQVFHPEIDRAILGDSNREVALAAQAADRWKLWPEDAVFVRFPQLCRLQERLNEGPHSVHMEFLALDVGRQRMAERTDWMPIRRPT